MVTPVIMPIDAEQAGCTAKGTELVPYNYELEIDDIYFGTYILSSTGYSYTATAADGWEIAYWKIKWEDDAGIHNEDRYAWCRDTISALFDEYRGYLSPLADTTSEFTKPGDKFLDSLLHEVTAVFKPKYGVILCNASGVILCDPSGQILCGGY